MFNALFTTKKLRNLVAAEELPDEFVFESELRIVALKSAVQSLGRPKDCLERCQSSEDGTFVALVPWMDETLVCEELLPLSSQLSPPHGVLFHE